MTRPNSKVSVLVLVSAVLALFLFDMALIANTPPPNCIIIPAKQSVVRNWLGFLSMPEKRCRSVFVKEHYLQFEFYDVDENLKSAACLIAGSVFSSSQFPDPTASTHAVSCFLSRFYIATTMWMREVGKSQVARKVMMAPVVPLRSSTLLPHSR